MRHSRFPKIIALLLALMLLLTAWGCKSQPPAPAGFSVVTSFYPMYLLTANVIAGVEGVQLGNMAAPEVGCLHDYQLLPQDVRALETANVLIAGGAGMESFLSKVTQQLPALIVVEASSGIPLITNEGEPNPHVWLHPLYAAKEARTIAAGLAAADQAHAQQYLDNGEAYAKKLEALYAEMQAQLSGITHREIITFHEAFPYFALAFGLEIVGVVEREPGSEPGTLELAQTVDLVREKGVPALFAEPQYPNGAAQLIARETGAKLYVLDPVVTGELSPDAYEKTMRQNAATLKEALQ